MWSIEAYERMTRAVRDLASFGAGLYWGNSVMTAPGPADPWKVALVASLLSVPFAARADEARRRVLGERARPSGPNGSSEATASSSSEREGS